MIVCVGVGGSTIFDSRQRLNLNTDSPTDLLRAYVGQWDALPVRCIYVLRALHPTERRPGLLCSSWGVISKPLVLLRSCLTVAL